MARTEADREDLLQEATALRRRVEFVVPGDSQPIVAGIRAGGELSIYFGADSAFHFDAHGHLRRAFADGLLYRTQGTTLARLRRERTPSATTLVRHDLTVDELNAFVTDLRQRLQSVRAAISEGHVRVVRQVPEDDELMGLLIRRIDEILSSGPSLAPAIRGKR